MAARVTGGQGWRGTAVLAFLLVGWLLGSPAQALDDEHWAKANAALERGIAYLRKNQNPDGSWSPKPGPAITAMAVRILLDRPDVSTHDPAVAKGIDYVLSKVKPDGGIHDGFLENYNTAIVLSGLSRVSGRPDVAAVVEKAQDYLRGLQWADRNDEAGKPIDKGHAFYGGAGYGNHGRPDMSNTQIMLEGLYDSGLSCQDPAFQRALVFISRCQGVASNQEFGDKIEQDGGFIYATSVNKDLIGVPQSMASPEMEQAAKAGQPVSGLRTYGSMTYAGFKSYIYANLDRNDERVVAAYNWIRRNYTLEANPGLRDDPATPSDERMQGYFYYLMTFSRAMDAWGASAITLADGSRRDWANDLIAKVVSLQGEDGSWKNDADRWMEGDPVLVTCYALIALQHAMK